MLGEEHPYTLVNMTNLASTYLEQGRLVEAEKLLVHVLEREKQVLGRNHPDTLVNMTNLASTYRGQGRVAEAEELLTMVLETGRRIFSDEHPNTLIRMANIALIYSDQRRWIEAEALLVRVIEIGKRVLSDEHPFVLTGLNHLASVLRCQGKNTRAEEILLQALVVMERVHGKNHPSTLTSTNNLALVLSNKGMHKEAEAIYRQGLALRGKVLGPEHPDTLTSMNNVAEALSSQGEYEQAEAILRQTLMLRKKVLGKEHPATLISTIGLGEILQRQGRYIESEEVLLYALTKQIQALSAESPDIQRGIDSLTSVLIHGSKTQFEFISDHKHNDKYCGMLQIAAVRGSEELVRQLVQKRIQVNFANATYKKALETAANCGHTAVVGLLLVDSAESGSEDTIGNALRAASAGGHEAVVRLLLEKVADINALGGSYGSALQAASAGDYQSVRRLLTDTALTFSSICDNRRVRDEDDTASFVSSTTSTVNLALPSTTSDRSLPSSVTSLENKLPEEIFKLLTFEVLLDPDIKPLCEKMLKIKGESLFIRLFKHEIRSFCSALYTENLTEIQKVSIRILRRYRAYFAFRICQLLKPSTIRKGWQLEDLVDQTVEAGVEKYLQGLRLVNQSPRDDTTVETTSGMGAVETASQDSRSAEDHAGSADHGIVSVGNKQADDAAEDASKFPEDGSSASNSSDNELDIIPQSLTKDTI